MLPVLVHYCDTCGYNTPVKYTTNLVWIQEHTCNHVSGLFEAYAVPIFPRPTN
jgi:hypothetical protein